MGGLFKDVHSNEKINVRDVFGIHIEPAQFTGGLAQQLLQLHVFQFPFPIDGIGLKTFRGCPR